MMSPEVATVCSPPAGDSSALVLFLMHSAVAETDQTGAGGDTMGIMMLATPCQEGFAMV